MAIDNKEKEVLNVPHLRFPEFSGEWKKHSLGEIGETIIGLTYKPSDVVDNNGIIVFRSSNIKNGMIDYSDLVRVNKYIKDKIITKENDILVCARNGSQRLIGKNAIIKQEDANNTFGAFMMVYRANDNPFILPLLSTNKYFSQVGENLGARINQITTSDFNGFEFYFPENHAERTKIAELFRLLDERIATQNKIIEDLKKLKSAISKQAFAQKPNGWNRLDTLFSKGKAGGTPTSTNKEYYNGEIPFLSINDITKQGKYVRYTENHLSRSGLENSSAWVVPEYSLIISMYASVGLVTINEVPITTSQAMFAMQLRDKDLLDYLYYYLSYFKYRHIHKYLETGTQSNINADIVRGIMIPTYGHSRNMKIASTLQGIDAKIDNELSVLKLFNRQKNYLLSQMFI